MAQINKPTDYFNTKLYAGNSGTQSITGVGFQPDFLWIKRRTIAGDHNLVDVIRTSDKTLISNDTGVEYSNNTITSFDSDGFSLSGSDGALNASGSNYVAWNWLAGTSVSGTTTGSGTSKAYSGSVNTTSGFSIIKYIGNGTAGHQIPHHLNAVPKMIILKNITGGAENWFVYHASLGNTKDIHLNTSGASATADSWNNTTPTSTVWTMSDQSAINSIDGNDHIAYCFAEKKGFSKFGSYVGNGNADGTFVYTGFKPAFTIIKRITDGTESWILQDNKRSPANPSDIFLAPNSSDADNTTTNAHIDYLSNGFKLRHNDTRGNTSGITYIYMAFAESPLVGTNNIPATAR